MKPFVYFWQDLSTPNVICTTLHVPKNNNFVSIAVTNGLRTAKITSCKSELNDVFPNISPNICSRV
jgi:hypothetical protein